MVQEEDQQINTFRLLDTDNRVVLTMNSPIQITVTAADVLLITLTSVASK